MDPKTPQGAADDFLPMDFHENLDDEGNFIGEEFVPENGEPLDNEDPMLNDGLDEEDDELPAGPEGLKKFARK